MKKTIAVIFAMTAAVSADATVRSQAQYDVGDYVQNGLVAHYDGIRNAGSNLPHDDNAAQWVDLASNGVYATLMNVPNKGDYDRGYWTTNAFHFAGFSCMQMSAPLTLGANFTIQAVLDADLDSDRAVADGRLYPTIFTAIDGKLQITMNRSWATPVGKTNIYWQTDQYSTAGNSNGRPTLDPFAGKYVNAAFSSEVARSLLSQTASFTKSGQYVYKANKSDASVEALTYSWGGRSGLSNAAWGFAGNFHALRIYTRVLSDDELAWNMAVDECRFRGAALAKRHVVVAESAYAGVCGAEAAGTYEVLGSHTFTAPDVTIGNVTYSAVGYTLETWNGSYWASAARFEGNSYTYTTGGGDPLVRLTWLWKPSGCIRAADYDACDYVQGGLIAQYDGIRNVAADLPHDASAAVWRDLKSSNYMTFNGTNAEAAATGFWTDGNAYFFAGYSYARMAEAISMGSNITVQLAVDIDNPAQIAAFEADSNRIRTPNYFSAGTDSGAFANIYSTTQRRYIQWKNDSWTGSGASVGRANFNNWNYKYLTGITTDDKAYLFQTEGYGGNSFTRTKFLPFTNNRWTIGGSHYDSSATSDANINSHLSVGKYYSARFYNRPLTEEELVWNRKIDEVRFHGAVPTNVIVEASSYNGVCGVEAPGVYEVVGSHTFSAPDVTVGDVTYSAIGYTLETWTGSYWASATRYVGNSYTYTVADNAQIVRLAWLWKPVRGIRAAADYDACDYVQGGLVAQYDGIRNAGANLPHDATASVWRNLKSDNYLAFAGTNAEAAATGSWTDGNAYFFAGYSYARMAEALSMGSNITVQLAVDIDNAAQIAAYEADSARITTPMYVAAGTDNAMFSRVSSPTQRRYVQWKNDSWTGSTSASGDRANFNGWNFKYLTGITTDDLAYLFQTEGYGGNSFTRTKFLPFTNIRWTVGGAHYDSSATSAANINLRLTIGKYHSARFYNRPLTEDELVWNRKVDEIRFRGVVVTNVVVASGKDVAQGLQPNGVYEVLGEGTFTAGPVPVTQGGTHFSYVPRGYTIERWSNGAWGAPEAHEGSSYTYNVQDEGGAIVRLTWKWRSDRLGSFIYLR